MKLTFAVAIVVCVFGLIDASRFRGNCKGGKVALGRKCTKYGFYEVKQCLANSETCRCVHPWSGEIVTRVDKESECPPCLLANANSYKMSAEGMADMNVYDCASDGYYDDENVQCMWHACFCYNREGESIHMLSDEERYSNSFSCKSVQQ